MRSIGELVEKWDIDPSSPTILTSHLEEAVLLRQETALLKDFRVLVLLRLLPSDIFTHASAAPPPPQLHPRPVWWSHSPDIRSHVAEQ